LKYISLTVGIHKCIRNGYIETVTWIAHRPCLMMSEIISWITNDLFTKETSVLSFPSCREQGRRESTLKE